MLVPELQTVDGFEFHFALNYLGHFLLTNLLLDIMKRSGLQDCCSRIVNMSSATHYAGVMNMEDLNRRYNSEGLEQASPNYSMIQVCLLTCYQAICKLRSGKVWNFETIFLNNSTTLLFSAFKEVLQFPWRLCSKQTGSGPLHLLPAGAADGRWLSRDRQCGGPRHGGHGAV